MKTPNTVAEFEQAARELVHLAATAAMAHAKEASQATDSDCQAVAIHNAAKWARIGLAFVQAADRIAEEIKAAEG